MEEKKRIEKMGAALHPRVREYLDKAQKKFGFDDELIFKESFPFEDPTELMGVQQGSDLLIDVILKDTGKIALNRDYDLDGMTSGSIAHTMLLAMNVDPERIVHMQNSRKHGNGFNGWALSQLEFMSVRYKIDVMITSDHGSADEERYQIARELYPDMKMIVTDHHLIPNEIIPATPEVFINPQQPNSNPRFKNLSGGVVVWYLMLATANKLRQMGYSLNEELINSVTPMAALTTICDQMNMLDPINRNIVKQGLQIANKSNDPKWEALRTFLKTDEINSSDLAYLFGPMINAAGRLDQTLVPHTFYMGKDYQACSKALRSLKTINNKRKDWQKRVTNDMDNMVKGNERPNSLIMAINEDITGIAGPIASSYLAKLRRPVIIICVVGNTLKGSCRSVPGVHLKNVLDAIKAKHPGILIKHGGHAGAAGVEVVPDRFKDFQDYFEEEVAKAEVTTDEDLTIILEDGEDVTQELYDSIIDIGPFGNMWKEPDIEADPYINSAFTVGRQHVIYTFGTRTGEFKGFDYFGKHREKYPNTRVRVSGNLSMEVVKGVKQPKIFIRTLKGK